MVKSKTILSVILIVALASAAGYALGWFSNPTAYTVTTTSLTTVTKIRTVTTTSPTTVTATSATTRIVTSTITTTATGEQPLLLHPSNPSAIIRSRLLLNRSVLMIVSMDKSIYNLLETAHIKGTVTNLTPTPISIHLNHPGVLVKLNGTKLFWAQPTDFITGGFGASWSESIQLGPGETATIDYLTADWNLVGIQLEGGRPVTRGFIPAGNYSITWRADMQDGFQETATFEFNK